jgi:hypothetical protein
VGPGLPQEGRPDHIDRQGRVSLSKKDLAQRLDAE